MRLLDLCSDIGGRGVTSAWELEFFKSALTSWNITLPPPPRAPLSTPSQVFSQILQLTLEQHKGVDCQPPHSQKST